MNLLLQLATNEIFVTIDVKHPMDFYNKINYNYFVNKFILILKVLQSI